VDAGFRECLWHPLAKQCQPLNGLVAEHEAGVATGDFPSQPSMGVAATLRASRRSGTSTQSSPSASGMIVSNHGGCQLDTAPATIDVLAVIRTLSVIAVRFSSMAASVAARAR